MKAYPFSPAHETFPLADNDRSQALAVITAADLAVRSAAYGPRPNDYPGFIHIQTDVDVCERPGQEPSVSFALARSIPYAAGTYELQSGDRNVQGLTGDAKVMPGAEDIIDAYSAVTFGRLGVGRVVAMKSLETDEAAALVCVGRQSASEGSLFPVSTTDLFLIRTHSGAGSMLSQTTRIQFDPNTDEMRVGHALDGDTTEVLEDANLYTAWTRVTDPFADLTAQRIASEGLLTPTNAPVTFDSWLRLIEHPVDARDLIR